MPNKTQKGHPRRQFVQCKWGGWIGFPTKTPREIFVGVISLYSIATAPINTQNFNFHSIGDGRGFCTTIETRMLLLLLENVLPRNPLGKTVALVAGARVLLPPAKTRKTARNLPGRTLQICNYNWSGGFLPQFPRLSGADKISGLCLVLCNFAGRNHAARTCAVQLADSLSSFCMVRAGNPNLGTFLSWKWFLTKKRLASNISLYF